ncbi:MAG: glycosyltransferase [candidate division KSB1 bacterium]|nr:glycosyltransferase [candidate division KSB1 bacterium]
MITIYLYIILAMLSFFVLITLINVLTAPLVRRGPAPPAKPLVSICIPVRNERDNIGRCLLSLVQQDYPNLEILVLNDHSTDGTLEEIYKIAHPSITVIPGKDLPVGWTGKNWACHQLSKQANGEFFIFTDADNFYESFAVSRTLGWMQRLQLSLFSAFPQQTTQTLGEKLVIPVIDMFVYSFLVLRFTYLLDFTSMAAANGQWLAFSRRGYERIGGHITVKSHIVEDTELARRAKQKGEKILTAAGSGAVYGHMYHSWQEVWLGFSKNVYGLMGYHFAGLILFLVLLFSVYLAPWILVWFQDFYLLALSAIGIAILQRGVLALKFKHPFGASTLLNPLGIVSVMAIAVHSCIRYHTGSIQWKGRTVEFSKDQS